MPKINFEKIKHIHFTGIKGVGMTALALCAKDMGKKVSGSDVGDSFVTDDYLKKINIKLNVGFSEKNIGDSDLVIYTAAHNGENNPEVIGAKKRKIPVLSQGEALGQFMRGKIGISVCGVGGKTTTSAMIATIFKLANLNPSYAIGVANINPIGLPGCYDKKGRYFIAEADEYYSSPQNKTPKFLFQKPKLLVITNIEYDHPDVYKNLNQTIKTFKKFISNVSKKGQLIVNIDNNKIKNLIKKIKTPCFTYGYSRMADWKISNIEQAENNIKFDLINGRKMIKDIIINVPGIFNVYNAAAAVLVAGYFKIEESLIKKGLLAFKGLKRRFEFIQEIKGIKYYDDYAHHPTEISSLISSAKKKFIGKKIICIFQPHTFSRTKKLFKQFSKSLSSSDISYIAPIYASAREKDNLNISSLKLVKEVRKYNRSCWYVEDPYDLAKKIQNIKNKNIVIITLGAGDIFTWHNNLSKLLT